MRRASLVFAMLAIACAIPGRRREVMPPRQSPERDSLLNIDRARSDSLARQGIVRAMRAYLDPAVLYLRAGAHPSYGVDHAVRLLEAAAPQAAPFIAWQPIGGGLSRDRLSGYTFGIAVRSQPESHATLIERYVAYWTRPRGGAWRIAAYLEASPGALSTLSGTKPVITVASGGHVSALLRADSQYAERSSSLSAAAAARDAISDGGVLLTTTQLVVGPREVAEYFAALRSFSISWVPRDARVAASGDLGFTVGDALVTSLGPTGAATQRFTKYLTIWRKEADGRWRVVITGANDRPSPIGD